MIKNRPGMIFLYRIRLGSGSRWNENRWLLNNSWNQISVLELRRLLYTIVDNRLDTCFRYRFIGEMWELNFLRVVGVTDKGVLLSDEANNTFKCLGDLSQIMQFEIDIAVHNFMPHNHYEINLCEKSNLSRKAEINHIDE